MDISWTACQVSISQFCLSTVFLLRYNIHHEPVSVVPGLLQGTEAAFYDA